MISGDNISDDSDDETHKSFKSGKRFSQMVSNDSADSNISSRFVKQHTEMYILCR